MSFVEEASTKDKLRVAVVGGGLVGCLQALYLAKRGFNVDLYEKRKDIRKMEEVEGRSINLALSNRGREALRGVGLEDVVLDHALPLYSRLIHTRAGKLSQQPYGTGDQCIYSVDRRHLNELLLEQVEKDPSVNLHFEHQLVRADLEKRQLSFWQNTTAKEQELHIEVDFVFGCDGAYSSVRRQMMRWGRMSYQQDIIEHGYKELTMPPLNREFAMSEKSLHIWPRGEFMMIALPNQNRTFTLTLFMPFELFGSIETEEDLLAFFAKNFEDSIGLIGKDNLVREYFKNPTGSLISVKCKPHYMAESFLVMGDAAHAVVPFYGQGMNCGLEDCLILNNYLIETSNLKLAAQKYSETRWKDTNAIADLSMYNYLEMRSHTADWMFLFYKHIDNALHYLFPGTFIPLYTMVSFSKIPYAEVVARNQSQKKMVSRGLLLLKIGIMGGVLLGLYRYFNLHIPLQYRIIPCVIGCIRKDFEKRVLSYSPRH